MPGPIKPRGLILVDDQPATPMPGEAPVVSEQFDFIAGRLARIDAQGERNAEDIREMKSDLKSIKANMGPGEEPMPMATAQHQWVTSAVALIGAIAAAILAVLKAMGK